MGKTHGWISKRWNRHVKVDVKCGFSCQGALTSFSRVTGDLVRSKRATCTFNGCAEPWTTMNRMYSFGRPVEALVMLINSYPIFISKIWAICDLRTSMLHSRPFPSALRHKLRWLPFAEISIYFHSRPGLGLDAAQATFAAGDPAPTGCRCCLWYWEWWWGSVSVKYFCMLVYACCWTLAAVYT